MKRKKRVFLLFLAAVLLTGSFFAEKNLKSGQDDLDQAIQRYAPTGASIALIENGQIKEIRNYGFADKEHKVPVSNETRFKIASVSKTMTSYGVMQLVEKGVLDLDAPVNQYLTRWKIPESEFGEDKVTLRRLMSHTAGVTGKPEIGYRGVVPDIDEALREHEVHLKREPGVVFEYSETIGYSICQLVIEEVTGMSFEEYMVHEIFESSGMYHTDFSNESNEKGELAIPYAGFGKKTNVVAFAMLGGGGVTSTAQDIATFELALMDYYVSGCGEMFQEQKNTQNSGGTYGLGIIPRKLNDGRIVYEHNGTLTGWNAQLVLEPESKNGIAVVTNSDKAYYLTYELMEIWSKMVLGEQVSDPMMRQMQDVFHIITFVLFAFTSIFGILLLRNIFTDHVQWKTSLLKAGISVILFLIFSGLDFVLFYTELPGKYLWNMDHYYLFTFFPPVFQWIQIMFGCIGIMLLLRWNMKKQKKKAGKG